MCGRQTVSTGAGEEARTDYEHDSAKERGRSEIVSVVVVLALPRARDGDDVERLELLDHRGQRCPRVDRLRPILVDELGHVPLRHIGVCHTVDALVDGLCAPILRLHTPRERERRVHGVVCAQPDQEASRVLVDEHQLRILLRDVEEPRRFENNTHLVEQEQRTVLVEELPEPARDDVEPIHGHKTLLPVCVMEREKERERERKKGGLLIYY